MPRFYVDLPLSSGLECALPAGAARHVQVLRLQPGEGLVLFDGQGWDWDCELLSIGRSEVRVRVGEARRVERELPIAVTLAVGMPANERMDWLVEKATELGVASLQPLVCERSILRLHGERADKRRLHWQGIAAAAAEQCGRACVPHIAPVASLANWLAALPVGVAQTGFVLSLRAPSEPLAQALVVALSSSASVLFLSGPEGGLSDAEDESARRAGLRALTLGPRVLRADTAPLLALAALTALFA